MFYNTFFQKPLLNFGHNAKKNVFSVLGIPLFILCCSFGAVGQQNNTSWDPCTTTSKIIYELVDQGTYPGCSGCTTKEVGILFEPSTNGYNKFVACNIKISGKITVTGGNGKIVGICKDFFDADGTKIAVATTDNTFTVLEENAHTIGYASTNNRKPAFSLIIVADAGATVTCTFDSPTTLSKTIPSAGGCQGDNCNKGDTNPYSFNIPVAGGSNCPSSAAVSIFVDYANVPNPGNTNETSVDVYVKNNLTSPIDINQMGFDLLYSNATFGTTVATKGAGEFLAAGNQQKSYVRAAPSNPIYFGAGVQQKVATIKVSTNYPIQYGKVDISNSYKFVNYNINGSPDKNCCVPSINDGDKIEVNKVNTYGHCQNLSPQEKSKFKIVGKMITSKRAEITVILNSDGGPAGEKLDHLWGELAITKNSNWTINTTESNFNSQLCPSNNQSTCAYNHSTSTNCLTFVNQNQDRTSANFGFCVPDYKLLNEEQEIAKIVLDNSTSCSLDDIKVEAIFLQMGSIYNSSPCVPEVTYEGFPIKGNSFKNATGEIILNCKANVENINVLLKNNGTCTTCNGDCIIPTNPPSFCNAADAFTLVEANRFAGCAESITPCKSDDVRQFVTTADLVVINKHILAVESLTSPYQYFAADVNKDFKVSTADMVKLRKVILFILNDFQDIDVNAYKSWRFIPSDITFDVDKFPITNSLPTPTSDPQSCVSSNPSKQQNYVGVKIGDVTNCYMNVTNSGNVNFVSVADKTSYQQGETVKIRIRTSAGFALQGLQAGLRFDPQLISFNTINTSVSTPFLINDPDNIGSTEANHGDLRFLWYHETGGSHTFTANEDIIELQFTALQNITSTSNLISLNSSVLEGIGVVSNTELKHFVLDNSYGFSAAGSDRSSEIKKDEKLPFGFEKFEAEVIPNPSKYEFGLKITAPVSGNYKIIILDPAGKVVLTKNVVFEKGVTTTPIEGFEKNSPGIYFFKVASPNGQIVGGKLARI